MKYTPIESVLLSHAHLFPLNYYRVQQKEKKRKSYWARYREQKEQYRKQKEKQWAVHSVKPGSRHDTRKRKKKRARSRDRDIRYKKQKKRSRAVP